MNERIKQLLNQATIDALHETKDAVDFLDNPVSKQQRELQLEKFALLIVQDNIMTLRSHGYDDAAQVLQDIHFGIEDPV